MKSLQNRRINGTEFHPGQPGYVINALFQYNNYDVFHKFTKSSKGFKQPAYCKILPKC